MNQKSSRNLSQGTIPRLECFLEIYWPQTQSSPKLEIRQTVICLGAPCLLLFCSLSRRFVLQALKVFLQAVQVGLVKDRKPTCGLSEVILSLAHGACRITAKKHMLADAW